MVLRAWECMQLDVNYEFLNPLLIIHSLGE